MERGRLAVGIGFYLDFRNKLNFRQAFMEIGEGCRQIDAVILTCVVEMGYRVALVVIDDGVENAGLGASVTASAAKTKVSLLLCPVRLSAPSPPFSVSSPVPP